MRFGLHVAPFGELADARVLADLAARSESVGFDGFFLWDHIDRPHRRIAIADTTVCLAAIAVATTQIRFGALVTPLVRRRPAKFARETATLDRLSGGRLVVGVGIGVDSGGELSRLGEVVDTRERGDLLDESLELIAGLWRGAPVTHRGRAHVADDVQFTPTPLQQPRPLVWAATRRSTGRPVQRAARFDGVVPEVDVQDLPPLVEEIARHRGSLDRFDVVAKGAPGIDPAPWNEAGATWWLTALPELSSLASAERVIDQGPPR